MFKGKITAPVLDAICVAYGTGDPDPVEPGSFVKVRSELFATDFDDIPLPGDPGAVVMPARWRDAMIDLRDAAGNKQLDLTDAFSEYSGTGREAQIGIMLKDRFRSAMGVLFAGIRLEKALLDAICDAYGTGVPDRRGGLSKVQGTPPPLLLHFTPRGPTLNPPLPLPPKVRWKQFAIDFDEIPRKPPPPDPDPTDEIYAAMREMNVYTNRNAIDLAEDFENYLGGKDKCASDVMPTGVFKRALGVLLGRATSLYQIDEGVLDAICLAYKAGRPLPRDPSQYEAVQWKEFAKDVNNMQAQPYLNGLQGGVAAYPQQGHYYEHMMTAEEAAWYKQSEHELR